MNQFHWFGSCHIAARLFLRMPQRISSLQAGVLFEPGGPKQAKNSKSGLLVRTRSRSRAVALPLNEHLASGDGGELWRHL
jgi:hypothetical protein